MLAMNYEITLPADYDMGIIRERVATRGHALDDFAGLRLKAYLIREVGVAGSPVNQYSPFYLWDDVAAMGRFLWEGAGFGGIVRDFGRPVVQTWAVVEHATGATFGSAPGFASKTTSSIPALSDPQHAADAARAQVHARVTSEGVHSSVAAIDPRSWQVMHLTLGTEPLNELGANYEVLHISAPQ